MILKGKITITCVLLFTLLVTGCSRRMIDFTVISSKNTQLQIPTEATGPRVEGVDEAWLIGIIPFGIPTIKEAVDRAIESAGPGYDALTDGVLYQTSVYFVIGAKYGYKVVGTPIKSSLVGARLQGKNDESVEQPLIYHSSLGISNDEALTKLKIIKGNKPNFSD